MRQKNFESEKEMNLRLEKQQAMIEDQASTIKEQANAIEIM